MEITTSVLLIAVGVYLLAGILKGTLGIGFPTAVIAMMAMFVDARTAILLAIVSMIATNIWQVYRSGRVQETIKGVWPLALVMMVLIVVFTFIASDFSHSTLALNVGIAVVIFAATSLWLDPPALKEQYKLPAQIGTGVVAGIMGGLAAIWAPAIVVYLTATRMDKEEFVATAGLLLLMGSVTLFCTFWAADMITLKQTGLSALLVVPSILGFTIGESLRAKVSNDLFRKLMLWFFLLMGLNLLWRGFSG